MEYFWMKQDRRYDRIPIIRNLNKVLDIRNLTPQKASCVENRNVVFTSSEHSQDYLDVLDKQLYLVSEKVKTVFEIYDSVTPYKFFCILNNLTDQYFKYYAPIFPIADAFSLNSETDLNRSFIKKLVLKEKEISDYSYCKISNIQTTIVVVRIDVAESILRRQPKGIEFVPVKLEKS